MSVSKPTFVLVPGAWHPSSVYSTFLTHLHRAGFPAVLVNLPSLDAKEPSSADCQQDAASIRQQMLPLMDNDGQSIVVLCHSYGGIPGGGAAHSLSKILREKQGKQGGVIGLIYMSSFVVPEGESLLNYLGGEHPPYLLRNQPSQGLSVIAGAETVLFADAEPEAAAALAGLLLPHAMKAFESPSPPTAWAEPNFANRIAFLRCTEDQALPTFLQDMFTEKSGVQWKVANIEASHSPWASKPKETAMILGQWANEFTNQA